MILIIVGLALCLGEALLRAMFGQYGAGSAIASWCGIAVFLGVLWAAAHIRRIENGGSPRGRVGGLEHRLRDATVEEIRAELEVERSGQRAARLEIKELAKRGDSLTSEEEAELRALTLQRQVHVRNINHLRSELRRRT